MSLTLFAKGDEKKPACSKCLSRGEKCEWDTAVTFRYVGLGIGHPPMRQPEGIPDSSSLFPAGRQPEKLQTHFHGSLEGSPNQEHGEAVETAPDAGEPHGKRLVDDGSHENRAAMGILSSAPDQQLPLAWHDTRGNLDVFDSKRRCYAQVSPAESEGVAGSSRDLDPGPNVFDSGNTISSIHYVLQSSPQTPLANECSRMIAPLGHPPPRAASASVYTDRGTHLIRGTSSSPDQTAHLRSSGTDAFNSALNPTLNTGQYALYNTNNNDPGLAETAPQTTATELDALDYLLSNPKKDHTFTSAADQDGNISWPSGPSHEFTPADQITADSPDAYAMYYPDPAYKELHTVLHYHMVETAKSTALTRQGTPEAITEDLSTMNDLSTNRDTGGAALWGPASLISASEGVKLTSRRELELWQNYLQEIAVWLDMFDMERHFQLKIPLMAKSSDYLRYSILALSARQLERKDLDKPYIESLTLYQKAIELIVRELRSLDVTVIASCVLLCVLEMMSSSPKAWARHLDGCAMLLQAAGINGTVGGVRQALFWCFARMDVWGGFLSDTLTKIPTSHWFIPSASMSMAVSRFKSSLRSFDSYANYAVFLCASVVNVLSDQKPPQSEHLSDLKASNCSRWKALFDLLEDWYNSRPEEMRPLMSCPALFDDHRHPFPIVLYGTSPAINGNQLYHASAILMLQEKPKAIRLGKGQKSIQWHARQICGIAVSNDNHGPWINALQPLRIAGKVMSHPTEHRIILNILTRIEKETGWATSWLSEDLKEYWGDPEE